MAKQYRVASVEDDVVKAIDKGATLYKSSKKIESELKGLKGIISNAVEFEGDETSVRAEGNDSNALITKRTSFSVEDTPEFEKQFTAGEFGDAIKASVNVNVPHNKLAELQNLLETSGFSCTRSFSVDADVVKEGGSITAALNGNMKTKEVLAVKFESKD